MHQQRTHHFIINSNTQTIHALYLYAAGQNNEQIRRLCDLFIHSLSISYAKYRKSDSHKIHHSVSDYTIFFIAQQRPMGHGLLIIEASRSHSVRHTTLGRTPLYEWSAPSRDLYLKTHTTLTRDKVHAPGGIRTRNPSTRAVADPCLRPRGHWDRPLLIDLLETTSDYRSTIKQKAFIILCCSYQITFRPNAYRRVFIMLQTNLIKTS